MILAAALHRKSSQLRQCGERLNETKIRKLSIHEVYGVLHKGGIMKRKWNIRKK